MPADMIPQSSRCHRQQFGGTHPACYTQEVVPNIRGIKGPQPQVLRGHSQGQIAQW